MKRATVHVAWGADFVREAQQSAATAEPLGLDRILVTDAASARDAAPITHFERVVTHDFRLAGLARKTEMFDCLPPDYESFLFLDTDTRILMDVRQGFDRAERHGIAAAQAAHYSLEHFWGFGAHLERIGFRSDDLLHYNTGVLFFTRDERAWPILQRWRALCGELAPDAPPAWTEQPFLTLAMEQAAFNPYTLSTAYNYRNFGELVSGCIRIWHSRLPPPADVNSFDAPWPPRRFRGSVRFEE